MKKLYSYLLAGLAVLMVSGLSAQVSGITVTDTSPCPGETVTVSWNAGSDGGTPFTVTVSTVSYGGTDVFGPSLFFANTVDFPVSDGETYYVTVKGNSPGAATNVPLIVTNEAPTIPTGYTLNGGAGTLVCSGASFDLASTGGSLGTNGIIRWYANDEVTLLATGNPLTIGAGIVAPTTYKVRIEDAICGNTTAFFPVTVNPFVNASGAATGVDFNGGASPVCPGTVTFAQTGAILGDNPATTVRYFSEATFTTEYVGGSTILASGANADVYVRVTDACSGANFDSGPFNVVAKTTSVDPTSVTDDSGGIHCAGTLVTWTAIGATVGTGGKYEYEFNNNGIWAETAGGGASASVATNPFVPVTIKMRLTDDCITTAGTAGTLVDVYTASTDVTAVTHTAGADNEICSGGSVTFTGNGALGNAPGSGFEVQITENGGVTAWAPTTNPLVASHTMPITALGTGTVVEFRVNDGCTGPGATAASVTVSVAANNVAPTTLTPSAATTCGTENVTFTTDGTLGGNGAVFQFSTDLAFGTILQSGTSNSYVASVSSDITMYVRILGGCNDVSGITPSAAVDFRAANVAPTTLTPSVTSVCAAANVTFTVNGTLGDLAPVFEFSEDGFATAPAQSGASNTYTTNVTADVTVSARISGGCNDVSATVVTAMVDFQAPNVAPTVVNASQPTTCGTESVTFTMDGTLGDGAVFEFSTDGFGTTAQSGALNTYTTNVSADVTVSARINLGCNDISATVVTTSVDYLSQNIAPTMVSASQATTCGTESVTFTMDGTLGDGGVYEFSTDGFGTTAQSGALNTYTTNVSADVTVSARINLGCNDVSATVVNTSVDYLEPNVAPTTLSPSQLTTCGTESVTFTADGTAGDGATYEFSGDDFATIIPGSVGNVLTINVSQDTTIEVRIVNGCNDVSATEIASSVDYLEPTDVSGLVVTYTDITDPLSPVTFDPTTDILCYDSDVTIKVSGIVIGDGATLGHRINGDPYGPTSLVDTTVTINNIQSATQIRFAIAGSCNPVANPIVNEFINVYDAIPEVTSLTIDKDNLCANDGEVVRLTAFTTVPVAFPYTYEWSKYKASNNTYTVIAGAPNAAIYDVTPDTITAYSVRIIGCNDTSAYVTQLVTVKDTSSVAGATIVTSADGAGSKVCTGKLVTYNLTGAKKGFDAVLYWYDSNDNLLGQGNPFIMNVTQDTTVYAKYVGECNTTVNSVSKTVEIFEQSDVAMAITLAGDTAQCVGSMADLATLTTRTPLGGTFTGANVAGGLLDVQLGMNVFTYTFNFGTCSFGVNDTIYGIAAPVAQVLTDSIVPNTCSGINVGEFQVEDINNEGLTFTATGGTIIGSIVYTTTTLDSVAEFTGLGAGVYAVTVTNSTGCNVVLPVTISSAAGLTAKIDTANSTLVVCNGADNGNVAILATGGVSPYVYSYDGGANFIASNDTTGLDGSEALNIVVKDASGCTFTVGAGSVLMNTNSVSLTLENIVKPTCYDALDGRFDAVASGAFGPYMYSLDGINFQSASRFDNLSVDVYTVTVKNALGCTRNFISPLLGPDSISVVRSIVSGDPINGYEVLFTVSGGNGGFEISINGGAFGTTFQLSQPAGAYNYVVRDVNGCTKSGSYELDGVDGINNVDAALSSVYPNPFTNTLTLVGNGIENATVIFTDLNGKTINVSIEASNEKVVISTSDVASGIYLVKVITENGSAVKRVIKN